MLDGTASLAEEYQLNGVTCIRGAFDQHWIDRLNRATTALAAGEAMKAYGGGDGGRFLSKVFLWSEQEDFRAFVFDSPAASIAGALMGGRHVNLFKDHLFVKEAGGSAPTPWHQDLPYWCVAGDQVISLWIALEPVDQENGAVRFVKGSHRWNKVFDIEDFGGESTQRKVGLEKVPDIDAGGYDIVTYDLAPGDCVAFHALTLHGAAGNQSTRRRAGYSVRFGGDDTTYDPHPAASKMFMDPGIPAGAPLGGPAFPRLWERA
jgi:ectoine hydroxylase-related dioxygenase (phytanoyl-CoA dioxygenase family)